MYGARETTKRTEIKKNIVLFKQVIDVYFLYRWRLIMQYDKSKLPSAHLQYRQLH
jgi:hypothetical protein